MENKIEINRFWFLGLALAEFAAIRFFVFCFLFFFFICVRLYCDDNGVIILMLIWMGERLTALVDCTILDS